MKIREIAYCFMSEKFLSKRVNMNYKKINSAESSKERMKILDDNTDILKALIYKHRDDKELLRMIKHDIENFIIANYYHVKEHELRKESE